MKKLTAFLIVLIIVSTIGSIYDWSAYSENAPKLELMEDLYSDLPDSYKTPTMTITLKAMRTNTADTFYEAMIFTVILIVSIVLFCVRWKK